MKCLEKCDKNTLDSSGQVTFGIETFLGLGTSAICKKVDLELQTGI